MNEDTIKVTQLPSAETITQNDLLMIVQNNENKKATSSQFLEMIEGELDNYYDKDEVDDLLDAKANTEDLSVVATSGSYTDLSNKPTIPTISDTYGTSTANGYSQNYINSNTLNPNGNATTTSENTSFNLTNTLEAPLEIDLKGNTSQTGTPTPSSPIPVNVVSGDNDIRVLGKNYVNNILTSGSINGITYVVNEDKSISLSGTATAETNLDILPNFNNLTIGETYTLSGCPSGGTLQTYRLFMRGTSYADYGSGVSFTCNDYIKTGSNGLRFIIANGVNVNGLVIKPQIEVGSTATTYEPYNGTTYDIDLPVENLFDKDNANVLNAYLASGDVVLFTDAERMIYIPCKPNTTYTITKDVATPQEKNRFRVGTTTDIPANNMRLLNEVYYNAGTTVKSITITTPSNANYLSVYCWATDNTSSFNDMLASLQIEEGSKANTYTPYGTTPIELCKIGTYQDYIYKENDKWYLHKETWKTILGVNNVLFENRYSSSSSGKYYFGLSSTIDMVKPPNNTILPVVLCDKLIKKTSTNLYNAIEGISLNDGVTRILVYADAISQMSLNDANAWLSSNNLIIYGALATPTNTEITYTPLIEQLNTLEQAQSKEGTTNINQVNNDLPFILDITAFINTYDGRYESLDSQIQNNKNDINNLEKNVNYSTNEQVIGKWIDGKPIYRKCFTGTTDPNSTTTYINLSIDKLIGSGGYIVYDTNIQFQLNSVYGSFDNAIRLIKSASTTIALQGGTNTRNKYYEIWVMYTKTTD